MFRQNEEDVIAAFIALLAADLEDQTQKTGGFPVPLMLPEPVNAAEQEGLKRFLESLQERSAADIQLAYR